MRISKSYAARVIARHAHDIRALRRAWKQRVPSIGAPNRTWAMDLSYASVPYDFTTMELGHTAPAFGQVENVGVDSGFLRQHLLLGIVDHGTRACIALAELADKSSASIWRELVECFKRYGVPKRLRVDNEACFHGLALRVPLALLGVRVCATDPASPWQNGRIERLFGTFKRDLANLIEHTQAQARASARVVAIHFDRVIAEWRWYYNFARPHQHLDQRTPAEAWQRRPSAEGAGQRIELWNGALKCVYFGPS